MRLGERLRREGHEEGYEEGARESLRRIVRVVIEARFGALPSWAEPQLLAADAATLDAWIPLLAVARSPDAVLTPPSPA